MTHTELKNSKIVVTIEIAGLDDWSMDFSSPEDVPLYLKSISRDITSALRLDAGFEQAEITSCEFIKGKDE